MKHRKIFAIILIVLSVSTVCFGQEFVEEENWLLELGGDYTGQTMISYEFNNFSKEDVVKAKQKLKNIREIAPKDEWEGIYYRGTFVGDHKLIWNAEAGFFTFYFYHQLKLIDFGTITASTEDIEMFSEKTFKPDAKLIKVKFGERHYLVPEANLQYFCILTAGLEPETFEFFTYYWAKDEDVNKKVFGLPILPKKYANLIRQPIEAKIIRIGSRKVILAESDSFYSEVHRAVTLNVGRNEKVIVGMDFYVEDLDEWVRIEKVFANSSIGFINRHLDDDKKELCRDGEGGSGDFIPCKKISVGMKARTKPSNSYF